MSETVCTRCGEIYPREAVTNKRVAQMAQRPGIGSIVSAAIWPDVPSFTQAPKAAPLAFTDQSDGADWVLTDPDGKTARQAEHKPWSAPSHWPWATVGDYRSALQDGIIKEGPNWPGLPSRRHEQSHNGRAWKGDCWSCYSVKNTGGQVTRLTIPQVVLYCVRGGLPCTLITDRGAEASVVYGTEPYYLINPDWVPVRTIPAVLNSLASVADCLQLSSSDHELLQDVVTRLWWQSPWEAVRALSEPANALVRPSARRH